MKPSILGWKNYTLDEIAEKVDYGHTASATDAAVGPRFLRITDIQNGRVQWDNVPYCLCSEQDVRDSALAPGEFVFARTGATTGKSFLIDNIPEPSIFASYLIRLRLKSGYQPRLLGYFFQTDGYWAQIKQHSQGATLPGVNASKLRSLKVALPQDEHEQRRIAAILDEADALRRKRAEAIRLANDVVPSVFNKMFGDPVLNRKKWPTTTIGERAELVTGYPFQSTKYTDSGVRLLRGANVLPDCIDWVDTCYWPASEPVDEQLRMQKGDGVIAMDRRWISTGFKIAQVANSDQPSYLVQRVARLRTKSQFSQGFIFHSLRHGSFATHCRCV